MPGGGDTAGAAFLDISTGEFRATQARGAEAWTLIAADIESFAPRELLFPAALAPLVRAGFDQTRHRTAPLPLAAAGSQEPGYGTQKADSLSTRERAGVRERRLAEEEKRKDVPTKNN